MLGKVFSSEIRTLDQTLGSLGCIYRGGPVSGVAFNLSYNSLTSIEIGFVLPLRKQLLTHDNVTEAASARVAHSAEAQHHSITRLYFTMGRYQ